MTDIEDATMTEAAHRLDLSVSSAKSSLQRARARLPQDIHQLLPPRVRCSGSLRRHDATHPLLRF